ncbi:MAG: hypothetical protein LBT05_10525 [Planctomycetaceae bacterium]|jgi:hypothetical protein|nr:hypothetical protein [Planctomycetaceae bacterium]
MSEPLPNIPNQAINTEFEPLPNIPGQSTTETELPTELPTEMISNRFVWIYAEKSKVFDPVCIIGGME